MSTMKSVVIGVVASAIVLVGCSSEPSAPQSDSSPLAPATSTPADRTGRMQVGPAPSTALRAPVTDLPPPPDATAPTIAVDDVRIEVDADTGTTRVVYRFTGTGVPFWRAGYVAEAVPYRGGPSLVLAGQAIMQVDIMDTATPAQHLYSAATPLAGPEGAHVAQLFLLPDARVANGVTQSFLGIRTGPRPFEILTVEEPPQLVIEIR